MYNWSSALFIYKFVFLTELLIAESIMSILLKKRKNFLPRFLLCLLGVYAFALAIPIVGADALWVSTMFTLMFLATLAMLFICYKDDWTTLLFCGVVAYTSQHVSYITGNFVTLMCDISNNSFYETTVVSLDFRAILIDIGFYCAIYLVLFVMAYYFYITSKEIKVGNLTLILVSAMMLTSNIILNAIVVYTNISEYSKVIYSLFFVYDVISCVATVMLLLLSVKNKTLQTDNETMLKLWNMDKENYRIKREKMETISIMCHDIKHRLQRFDGEYSDNKLRALEEVLDKYDTVYNTGNEVIDIILAEENTYCVNHGIQLVSFVDGKVLDFMNKEHIYSLFDNFLHNAIEAVENLKEPHKRYIKLNVSRKDEMIVINVENYFDERQSVEFVDGIPQSTKNKDELHGFGFKSIVTIVELYKGTVNVNVDGEMFFLDIFFPPPTE